MLQSYITYNLYYIYLKYLHCITNYSAFSSILAIAIHSYLMMCGTWFTLPACGGFWKRVWGLLENAGPILSKFGPY